MMKQKLKVSFDNPEHGWVGLTISQGEASLTVIASYTPSDSFLDLTNALYNLLCYRVGGIVAWHEEPAETEMRFSISGEEVKLEVYIFSDHRRDYGRGERELEITGSYEEICAVLASAEKFAGEILSRAIGCEMASSVPLERNRPPDGCHQRKVGLVPQVNGYFKRRSVPD
jgi:hypothetical protein